MPRLLPALAPAGASRPQPGTPSDRKGSTLRRMRMRSGWLDCSMSCVKAAFVASLGQLDELDVVAGTLGPLSVPVSGGGDLPSRWSLSGVNRSLVEGGASYGIGQRYGIGPIGPNAVIPCAKVIQIRSVPEELPLRVLDTGFDEAQPFGVVGQEDALAVDAGYGGVPAPCQRIAAGTVGQHPKDRDQSDETERRQGTTCEGDPRRPGPGRGDGSRAG